MTFHILANLDQEARWANQPLPRHVRVRISAAATLLSALAPAGEEVAIYPPADVTPLRLPSVPGWTPPVIRGGKPPSGTFDRRWADPDAKAVNDRRFAVRCARAANIALPGVMIFNAVGELAGHLGRGGAAASAARAWVCKAPWTSAGRDRVIGTGDTLDADKRREVERLMQGHKVLVFEPWLDRVLDVGVCGHVAETVTLEAPHRLLVTAHGGVRGIDVSASGLEVGEHDQVMLAAEHAGVALQRAGYRGPFGIDAFVYADAGVRRVHPLCEINARYTFGHVARALHARLGLPRLGFGEPPVGATVLVAPSPYGDTSSAWLATSEAGA